ncbi:MAG: glycosyltransferase family 2 protein [Phycisphaerales bacterium]|nr:glycosyltransferase family 2 protein [Phycisphaerales bacterium]
MHTTKLPITVVIPVKNEERNLPLCLARLARFERVIVVDSGSTDQTQAISVAHGCEFVSFRWDGHYPKKRNWLLMNHAPATPWVFFLDADEYLSDAFVDELAIAIEMTTHVGFRVMYSTYFLGRKLKYGAPMIKLPIFRVGSGLYERIDEQGWSTLDMEVHEHPVLNGSVGVLHTLVDHRDYKGLHAYIARHNEYSTWEARRYMRLLQTPEAMAHFTPEQRAKYGNLTRWWLPPAYFFYSYIYKRGFLDGLVGLAFAKMKAIYFSQIRLKIIEMSQDQSASSSR